MSSELSCLLPGTRNGKRGCSQAGRGANRAPWCMAGLPHPTIQEVGKVCTEQGRKPHFCQVLVRSSCDDWTKGKEGAGQAES